MLDLTQDCDNGGRVVVFDRTILKIDFPAFVSDERKYFTKTDHTILGLFNTTLSLE